MATQTRIFSKTVTLTTEGQFEVKGKVLKLVRWRLIADGVPGEWRRASPKEGNGGWPDMIRDGSELPPDAREGMESLTPKKKK